MKQTHRQHILKILNKRAPSLSERLMAVKDILEIEHSLRQEIADCLSDEFVERGLKDNDEPNAYGLEIEHLIGACRLTED